jgi:TRAP-type C4-dicarboxylate transport system permease small subunit
MAHQASRLARAFEAGMARVAGWIYVAVALLVTIGVLARGLFGISIGPVVEVSSYLLAAGISWGLSDALATKTHIRLEAFVVRLPLQIRIWFHVFALVLLTIYALVLTRGGLLLLAESLDLDAHDTSTLALPLAPPQAIWAFGLVVFSTRCLVMAVQTVLLAAARDLVGIDRLLGPKTVDEEIAEVTGTEAHEGGPNTGESGP